MPPGIGIFSASHGTLPSPTKKPRHIDKRNISAPTPISVPASQSPLIDIPTNLTGGIIGNNDYEDDSVAKQVSRSAKKWAKTVIGPLKPLKRRVSISAARILDGITAGVGGGRNHSSANLLGAELKPRPLGGRPASVMPFKNESWVGRRKRTDSTYSWMPTGSSEWDVSEIEGSVRALPVWTHKNVEAELYIRKRFAAIELLAMDREGKTIFLQIVRMLSPKEMASLSRCSKPLYKHIAPSFFCSIELKPSRNPQVSDSGYLEHVRFEELQRKLKALCYVSESSLQKYVKEIRVSGDWIILLDDYSDDEGTASLISSSKTKTVEEIVSELMVFLLKRTTGLVSFVWDSIHPIFPKVMLCLATTNTLRHLRLNVRTGMALNETTYDSLKQSYLPQLAPFNHLYSLVVTNVPAGGPLLSGIFKAISACPFIRVLCLAGVDEFFTSLESIQSASARANKIRKSGKSLRNYLPTLDWELYRGQKSYEHPFSSASNNNTQPLSTARKNRYKALLPLSYLGLKNFIVDYRVLNLEIDPTTLTHLSLINCYGDNFSISEEIAQNLRCITADSFIPEIIKIIPAFLKIDGSYNVEKLIGENLDLLNKVDINPRSTSLLPDSSLKIQSRICKDSTKKLSLLTNPLIPLSPRNTKRVLDDFLAQIATPIPFTSRAFINADDAYHPLTTLRLPAELPLNAQEIRKVFGVNVARGEAGEMALYHLNWLSLAIVQSPHAWRNFLMFLPNFYELLGIHLLETSEPESNGEEKAQVQVSAQQGQKKMPAEQKSVDKGKGKAREIHGQRQGLEELGPAEVNRRTGTLYAWQRRAAGATTRPDTSRQGAKTNNSQAGGGGASKKNQNVSAVKVVDIPPPRSRRTALNTSSSGTSTTSTTSHTSTTTVATTIQSASTTTQVQKKKRYPIDDAKDILLAVLDRQRYPRLKWIAVKNAVWAVERDGSVGERVVGRWRLRRASWAEIGKGSECHWGEEAGGEW